MSNFDGYDRISESEFKTAVHTQDPRTVFPGQSLAVAYLRALDVSNKTYDVDLEFDFTVSVAGVKSKHTMWKRIGHAVTLEAVKRIEAISDKASKYDLMFAALGNDWIDIQEVFGAKSDDPEEGATNWFWRHGIPANAEILFIYPAEITVRPLS